ncbi:hypothetical protein HK096_011412, partial [Nowakowskiella sp. JEL0078]
MSTRPTKPKRVVSRTVPTSTSSRTSVVNTIGKKGLQDIVSGVAAGVAGVQAFAANIASKLPASENDSESSSTSNDAISSKSISEVEAPKYPEYIKFYQQQQQSSYQDFDDNGSNQFPNDALTTNALENTEDLTHDIGQSIMYASVQQSDLVLNPWDQDNGQSLSLQSSLILDSPINKLTLDVSPSNLRVSSSSKLKTSIYSPKKKNNSFETSSTYSYSPQQSNDMVYSPKQSQSFSNFPDSKPLSTTSNSPPSRFDSVDPWSGKSISIGGSGANKQTEINRFVNTNTRIDDGPFGTMSPNHDPQDGVQWFENLDVLE